MRTGGAAIGGDVGAALGALGHGVRPCLWTLFACAALAAHAHALGLAPEREPLPMRIGEQRIVLGGLAQHVTAAHPERLRTVHLPGLGIHLRALAAGETALVWGHPPRLFASIRVAPAVVRDPPPPPLPAATPARAAWSQPVVPSAAPPSLVTLKAPEPGDDDDDGAERDEDEE